MSNRIGLILEHQPVKVPKDCLFQKIVLPARADMAAEAWHGFSITARLFPHSFVQEKPGKKKEEGMSDGAVDYIV